MTHLERLLRMKRNLIAVALCFASSIPVLAQKADKRLAESAAVLKTITTKSEISNTAWSKAKCVLVYPCVRKVGIGIGVSYGRGVLVCRSGADMDGKWGAPIMYTLDTGSLGAQLGSSSTDYVLLVITQRGANKILSGKLKLGAGASAVAGPTGANAAAFNDPNVDILSYSQSKGLFAGASLGSASMDADDSVNKELYGKDIDAAQMVRDGNTPIPAAAQPLINVLQKASAKGK
jgi:lipid-binding SYLF domain-containing protein